jgi:branched-chain amino acid transport system permease protein
MWGQILISGLIVGGKYALLALGFSLVFGVARIMNLTHTAYYMLAAYMIYYLNQTLNLALPLSYLIAIISVVAIGMAIYYALVAPVRERFAAVLIITLVMAIALQEAVIIIFGGHYRTLSQLIPGIVMVGGVNLTYQHLLTLGTVLLVLAGIWLLLFKSSLGIAIRAMAMDREVANLMGMPEGRVAGITMALSIGLAAIAGAMVAPLYIMEPVMWMHPLVVVMAAVILGGLGSIKGSITGAFILAFAEILLVFMVPRLAYLRGAVSMSVMLGVLLIRPEGLFGLFMEGER